MRRQTPPRRRVADRGRTAIRLANALLWDVLARAARQRSSLHPPTGWKVGTVVDPAALVQVTGPGLDGWLWGNPYAGKVEAVLFQTDPIRRLFIDQEAGRLYDNHFDDVGAVADLVLVPMESNHAD